MSRSACSWRRSAKAFRTSFGLSADGRAAAAPTSTRALQAATVMQVPHGAVNVHGHVHEQGVADAEPARQRQRRTVELPADETERDPAAGPPAGGKEGRARDTAPARG